MSWSEGTNTVSSGSGRVDDIEGPPARRDSRADEARQNAGNAMRWMGSPKVENAGCSRVNGARGSGAT
jgi:hypothetical protein